MICITFQNHMIGVHGDQKYTCDICHQVFNTTLGNFKKHRQNHLQKPEKCPECGKLVKRLAQHLSLNQCGNTKSKGNDLHIFYFFFKPNEFDN